MSTNLYEMFGTDPDLERNGIAVEYGEATFIIARAGGANRKFLKAMRRLSRPYRASINSETLPTETSD